jgi:hypothetical protein
MSELTKDAVVADVGSIEDAPEGVTYTIDAATGRVLFHNDPLWFPTDPPEPVQVVFKWLDGLKYLSHPSLGRYVDSTNCPRRRAVMLVAHDELLDRGLIDE